MAVKNTIFHIYNSVKPLRQNDYKSIRQNNSTGPSVLMCILPAWCALLFDLRPCQIFGDDSQFMFYITGCTLNKSDIIEPKHL